MALVVGEVFRRAAAATPDRVALSLEGDTLTFAELDRAADRMADQLREEGVGYGDRVGWWGETGLRVAPLFVAVARLGAVFVPVNTRFTVDEAAAVLTKARPRLLAIDEGAPEAMGRAVAAAADPAVAVQVLGQPDSSPGARPAADEPRLRETDPHVIFFTSGSTGKPKGVVLSHRVNLLRTFAPNMPMPGGPTVCMFPLFHMAGWTIGLGCWQARQELALVRAADAEQLLDAVHRRRAHRLYLIPAVWQRVLTALAADPARWDVSSLREADTGTSATPPELLTAIKAALPGTVTRIAYGSTEVGSGAVLGDEDVLRKPGSVGLPSPFGDVRLDERGEILIRNDISMDGYFEDPEATAAAVDADGWFHTGDLGAFDDEGYLSIVGRAKDVIRTGGETVAPVEVEAALADHPDLADVAVVGLPHPDWGEVVCAVVVPVDGRDAPDLEALREWCAERLAGFKVPRRVAVVDALPRTAATGQVQRALIVERLQLS
ncbi:MAG: hypothetical protein JWO37_3233 [Acidimicrobiales bacterium]|jgi:fatty-acyl-CoA synthase|nr:hypothetical protein [Acidimicrobiales bacterium]